MARKTSPKPQPADRPAAPSTHSGAEKLDPRVQRSRDAVLTTTFELLGESGVGGFTVDEVARRSGVAKTTIYRHWPSREALVIDACSRISDEQAVPDTGSLDGDLTAILSNIGHLLRHRPMVFGPALDRRRRRTRSGVRRHPPQDPARTRRAAQGGHRPSGAQGRDRGDSRPLDHDRGTDGPPLLPPVVLPRTDRRAVRQERPSAT